MKQRRRKGKENVEGLSKDLERKTVAIYSQNCLVMAMTVTEIEIFLHFLYQKLPRSEDALHLLLA